MSSVSGSSMSMKESVHLDRLLQKLDEQTMDENRLQPFLNSSSTATTVDESLIQRYTALKQEYLTRKIQQTFLDQLATKRGIPFDDDDDDDAEAKEEERQVLEERRQRLLHGVQEALHEWQAKVKQVQLQYATLQDRKHELRQRVSEFHQAQQQQDSMMQDDDDNDDEEDVDEITLTLTAEGERLAALQERKAKLMLEAQQIKEENLQLVKAVQEQTARLPPPEHDCNNMTLQQLQEQNSQLEQSIAKYKEMTEFYQEMRICLEELRGVRVLQVGTSSASSSSISTGSAMICVFQLLDEYELQVELEDHSGNTGGPTTTTTPPPEQRNPPKIIQLFFRNPQHDKSIGSLNDLLVASQSSSSSVSESCTTADRLRWILTEVLARIHLHHQRAREISLLHLLRLPGGGEEEAGGVHVLSSTTTTLEGQVDGGGGTVLQYHQVRCRLLLPNNNHKSLMIVLSLTPDCPLIPGSVHLDQLSVESSLSSQEDNVAVPENNKDTNHDPTSTAFLEELQSKVNQQLFSSPVDLVQHVMRALANNTSNNMNRNE